MSASRLDEPAGAFASPSIFERAQGAFAEVSHRRPETLREIRCTLVGQSARLRIAGRKLGEIMAAPFAHARRLDSAPPELEIELWDVAETGIPGPVQSISGLLEREWQMGEETLAASAPLVAHQLHESIVWLDRDARRIVGWIPSANSLSLHQRGKPLQTILSIWAHDRGAQAVHAGCIARDGAGIVLPGKGGAGKSTTALACALAGFSFLSDDLVVFDASFGAHSLYCSAWLDAGHARNFPALAVHATPTGSAIETKSLLMMSDTPGVRVAAAAHLTALALPRIVHRPAEPPWRATRAEALLVLAPSTVLQLHPRSGRREIERLAELTARAPAFWLELGTDLHSIPKHVEEILAAVR